MNPAGGLGLMNPIGGSRSDEPCLGSRTNGSCWGVRPNESFAMAKEQYAASHMLLLLTDSFTTTIS